MCGIAGLWRAHGTRGRGPAARHVAADAPSRAGRRGRGAVRSARRPRARAAARHARRRVRRAARLRAGHAQAARARRDAGRWRSLHRRLSIVDLSPAGHQPMCDAAGRSVDHLQRRGLQLPRAARRTRRARATRFHGHLGHRGDPRRLPAVGRGLPARASTACSRSRSGTPDARALFCARDRFGVKPFYYQFDGERLRVRLRAARAGADAGAPHRAAARRGPRPAGARLGGSRGAARSSRGCWQLPAGALPDARRARAARCAAGGRSTPRRAWAARAADLAARLRRAVHRRRAAAPARRRRGGHRASRAASTRARSSPPRRELRAARRCTRSRAPTTRARRSTSARTCAPPPRRAARRCTWWCPTARDFWERVRPRWRVSRTNPPPAPASTRSGR